MCKPVKLSEKHRQKHENIHPLGIEKERTNGKTSGQYPENSRDSPLPET